MLGQNLEGDDTRLYRDDSESGSDLDNIASAGEDEEEGGAEEDADGGDKGVDEGQVRSDTTIF